MQRALGRPHHHADWTRLHPLRFLSLPSRIFLRVMASLTISPHPARHI